VAAILLGGYSGVSFQAGSGLEFSAITAVVLGGVALGGGRGSVVGAMLGALTLELLFALMNFSGVSGAVRPAVQGAIILLAVAVAAARSPSR
jgi:ribose transport system permease protein